MCACGGHGAQIEPIQESKDIVSMEVEEDAHAPTPEKTSQDASAFQVDAFVKNAAARLPSMPCEEPRL